MRLALMLRVSTEDQRERQTVELQRQFGEKWAALGQHEIVDWYVDEGVSGTVPLDQRPDGSRLLADAAAGRFEAVAVYKLDRLGRSISVISNAVDALERLGVALISMTEPYDTGTPAGRAMMGMLATFAGFERDTIRERCSGGKSRAAHQGKYLGGVVPYGYRCVDGFIEPDTELLPGLSLSEADVVALIFGWALEKMTCYKLAERLTAMGIPTPVSSAGEGKSRRNSQQTRGDWPPETVRGILRNPTYIGVRTYGKSRRTKGGKRIDTTPEDQIEQQVPAMITPEVFEAVGRILTSNQTNADRNSKHPTLLRGLIRCGVCGFTFISAVKGGAGGKTRRYYMCNGRNSPKRTYGPGSLPCSAPLVRAEDIEGDLWATVLAHLRDAEGTLMKLQGQHGSQQQQVETLTGQQEEVRRSQKRNEEALRRAIDLMTDGLITRAEGAEKLQRLRDERILLQRQMGDLVIQSSSLLAYEDRLKDADRLVMEWRDRVKDAETNFSYEQKRHCVETFVVGITVKEKGGKAVGSYRLCFNAAETGTVKHTGSCCIEVSHILRGTGRSKAARSPIHPPKDAL